MSVGEDRTGAFEIHGHRLCPLQRTRLPPLSFPVLHETPSVEAPTQSRRITQKIRLSLVIGIAVGFIATPAARVALFLGVPTLPRDDKKTFHPPCHIHYLGKTKASVSVPSPWLGERNTPEICN